MLSVPIVRKDLYCFAQIGNELVITPFQNRFSGLDGIKGVQAKQVHRTEPPVDENPQLLRDAPELLPGLH